MGDEDGADEMDTRSLLERMKVTVEEMKRRRSLAPPTPVRASGARASLGLALRPVSPSKAAAATTADMMGVTEEEEENVLVHDEDKENASGFREEEDVEMKEGDDGEKENEDGLGFSLLRPGVLAEGRIREGVHMDDLLGVDGEEQEQAVVVDANEHSTDIMPVPVEEPSAADIDADELPAHAEAGSSRERARLSPEWPEEVPEVEEDDQEVGLSYFCFVVCIDLTGCL